MSDRRSNELRTGAIGGDRLAHRSSTFINLGALALALCWYALVAWTIAPDVDDLNIHRQAAISLMRSGDPYAVTPAQLGHTGEIPHSYLYPPLISYLIQPFALIEQYQAQLIWLGFNTIALGSLIAICLWCSGSTLARRYWGLVVLGTLLAPPVRLSLQLSQLSILLALMLIGGFVLANRSPAITGLLLSLASLIRLYPALLGLYYLVRGPRRVIWWSIAAGGILSALPLLPYGLTPYTAYLDTMLQDGYYPYAAEFNISVLGFFSRLFSTSRYAVPLIDAPQLVPVLTGLVGLGVLGLCLHVARGSTDQFGRQIQFDVWLCGMSLLAPSNGYYNLVLLLLPLLSIIRYLEQHPDRSVRNWLIIATALVCIPPAWSAWQPTLYNRVHIGWGVLVLAPAFPGLLIYLALLVVLARRYH